MRRVNRRRGFSLVELVVVLAILGIVLAVGIPRYNQITESARIRAMAADVALIETATRRYVLDTGERPPSISGVQSFEDYNEESEDIYFEGDGAEGWYGPYLDHWPEESHLGGVYVYRDVDAGNGISWLPAEARRPAGENQFVYIRFEDDDGSVVVDDDTFAEVLAGLKARLGEDRVYAFTNGQKNIAVLIDADL